MKIYIISFVFCFIFALCLFSCGFANYTSQGGVGFLDSRNAEDEDDESTGVFNSPSGRLESSNTCSDNEECVELCDSMLQRLSDQDKCYDETEEEVQALRDVYNLLAIGNPRKLERVDKDEMEPFLIFGPEIWKDAITGFEKGRKENCVENLNPEDSRDREDCKFDNYYKQEGYWSSGAVAALKWIARNNWLAELILENDDDNIIMTSLLDVLAHGGDGEEEDHRDGVCPLKPALVVVPPISIKLGGHYQALGSDCLDGKSFLSLAVEEENNYSVHLGHEVLEDICNRGEQSCVKYFYCNITNGPNQENRNAQPTSDTVLYYILYSAGINGLDEDYYSNRGTWCSGS